MSGSPGSAELCGYIRGNCKTILGSRFWDVRRVLRVDVGSKPEKLESKFLVISKFRFFFLSGKVSSKLKVENNYHLLQISAIEVADSHVRVLVDGKILYLHPLDDAVTASSLAHDLMCAFKHYFPECNVRKFMDLVPNSLYSDYVHLTDRAPSLPCGGFRRTYEALCDFYKLAYWEEVVWYVEKIYASHDSRTLRLEEFDHLHAKDLVPILAVLEYSNWFTGLSVQNVVPSIKFIGELLDVLIRVLRKNQSLELLELVNCGLKADFLTSFCTILTQNSSIPLKHLNFSKNNFKDNYKAISYLSASLLNRECSLTAIDLSDCGFGSKSVNSLARGIQSHAETKTIDNLAVLNLAGNSLKEEINFNRVAGRRCSDQLNRSLHAQSKIVIGTAEDELNKHVCVANRLLADYELNPESEDVRTLKALLDDAEKTKALIPKLLEECESPDFIDASIRDQLKAVQDGVRGAIEQNVHAMLKCPENSMTLPALSSSKFRADATDVCTQKAQFDASVPISDFSASLKQAYRTINLNVATTITEKIVQEIIDQLVVLVKRLAAEAKATSLSANSSGGSDHLKSPSTPKQKKKLKVFSQFRRPKSIVATDVMIESVESSERGASLSFDSSDSISMDSTDALADELPTLKPSDANKLIHLQKSRPKRPKNVRSNQALTSTPTTQSSANLLARGTGPNKHCTSALLSEAGIAAVVNGDLSALSFNAETFAVCEHGYRDDSTDDLITDISAVTLSGEISDHFGGDRYLADTLPVVSTIFPGYVLGSTRFIVSATVRYHSLRTLRVYFLVDTGCPRSSLSMDCLAALGVRPAMLSIMNGQAPGEARHFVSVTVNGVILKHVVLSRDRFGGINVIGADLLCKNQAALYYNSDLTVKLKLRV